MNIVTNSETAKVEDFMLNGEYSSVSLNGVKYPSKIKKYTIEGSEDKTERPNALRTNVVDDYMKMIVGSGKHIDYGKGKVVNSKQSLS